MTDRVPPELRGQSTEIQIAVLYERVNTLAAEVRGLKRALWAMVFSVLGGAVLLLLSVAAGWIGPHPAAAVVSAGHLIARAL